MKMYGQLYINGQWSEPSSGNSHEIINPANGEVVFQVPEADAVDVENAIAAAKAAFPMWSTTAARVRADFLNAIADEIDNRVDDFAEVITLSMGCPSKLVRGLQVLGASHAFRSFAKRTAQMETVEQRDGFSVLKQAVGVCSLINPWNYPLSQLTGKLAPALAAGCTVVAKPAEQTPIQDLIMAEICHKVGLPAGVFNVVPGHGDSIGPVMCSHVDVDMVSFTGSTVAGRKVSHAAADTIKRVTLELGGKSPYIVTEDADLESAIKDCVTKVMVNSGQSCNAPTRLIIPKACYQQTIALAKQFAEAFVVGDPQDRKNFIGPLSSEKQKERVLNYIQKGIEEGARLIAGGTAMPAGLSAGAYVKPTVFASVKNSMIIAQEEIFGPVVCLICYDSLEEAIAIANDSDYGLSSNIYAKNTNAAMDIAKQIRAGQSFVQGCGFNGEAPFGGYKQSGNGREWGDEGLMEYCEIKAVIQ